MKPIILLLVCIQVFCCRAAPPQSQEPPLTSIPCTDPGAEAAADLSLRQLNANRREGFVFGLKRISSALEQFEERSGVVYYLTLDVLETECHVLSRRAWKDCEPKPNHEAVFGQCKVIFHLNKPMRIAHLYSYECALRPVARGVGGCPGCVFSQPKNHSSVQDIVNKAIEKYNNQSAYDKYFTVGNITKSTSQVIAGTAYKVEFTIHETSCNKSLSAEELALCKPLDCEFAHTGYCKSRGLAHWSRPDDPYVTVTCDIFEPEAAAIEEQNHKKGHNEEKPERSPGKSGEKHGKKPERSSRKQNNKKDHKHDHDNSESHEDEHNHDHLHPHEHHHGQQGNSPAPESAATVGKIVYLGNEEEPTPTAANREKKAKKSDGDKTKQEKPKGPKGEKSPPGLKLPKPYIRPFPAEASTSDRCPGPVKNIGPQPVATEQPTAIPK
ncbi:fetuin-B-like [Spea bombifrons]|uniref:fetuin-B-like n=1 Tax=Spea bombifrons TaxID=233779 RepID=UPI00234A78CB|nr:fetuin-B-like [Spea bombifrons]